MSFSFLKYFFPFLFFLKVFFFNLGMGGQILIDILPDNILPADCLADKSFKQTKRPDGRDIKTLSLLNPRAVPEERESGEKEATAAASYRCTTGIRFPATSDPGSEGAGAPSATLDLVVTLLPGRPAERTVSPTKPATVANKSGKRRTTTQRRQ